MNGNYRAWNINIDTLMTPCDFVKVGILAPSSHNSQPWSFRATDDTLSVCLNPSRLLPESDRNDRQSYISLGCAIANIESIAAYHGCATVITYTDNGADMRFLKSEDTSALADLAPYLAMRVTNRSAYAREPLSEALRNGVSALAVTGTEVHLVEDAIHIAALGEIAIDASISAMEDSRFREELSRHVLPNTSRGEVGMPGFGLGFPLLVSFIVPYVIRALNVAKLSRAKDVVLFKNTSGISIVETKNDTKEDWMNAGRTYERIALLATSMGYSTAPWGAPIQIGGFHMRIAEALGLLGRPQVFFRIGRAVRPVNHSPRVPAERVFQ